MGNESSVKLHWSFWVVCIIGLVWNAGGAVNYLMQTNMEFVSSMPATHQAIIVGRPIWATGGFAIGVFGGVLGCIFLLLKRRSSINIFLMSLIGIIVTMVHTIDVAMSDTEFSILEIIVMVILPLVVALALVLYAKYAIVKYVR
jgi:Ca2+/Na+ antiporter